MAQFKIFIIAVVMAMMTNIANAQTDTYAFEVVEDMIENGTCGVISADQHKLEHQPRHEEIQLYAFSAQGDTLWGALKSVYKDGSSIAITAGFARFAERNPSLFNGTQPMLGVSYQRDGIFGWYKKDGTSVHPFGIELNFSLMPRRYEYSSSVPHRSYFSYKTTFYGKYRLYESGWMSHRINFVAGLGYLFSKDKEEIVADDITFHPAFTGSGLTAGGGFEYRYQFPLRVKKNGKANRSANDGIGVKLMAEYVPKVEYREHTNQLFLSLTVSYTFGINRWITER